jgi:hypothetical protein
MDVHFCTHEPAQAEVVLYRHAREHGIRLVPIRGPGGAILYEAESAAGDETDPPAERHRRTDDVLTAVGAEAYRRDRLPVTRTGKADIQLVDRRRNGGFVDFDSTKNVLY